MAERKKPSWTEIKRKLTPINQAGLIGLVKDLFDASPENRTFLASRFLAAEDSGAALAVGTPMAEIEP